jgi:hypothetical protein
MRVSRWIQIGSPAAMSLAVAATEAPATVPALASMRRFKVLDLSATNIPDAATAAGVEAFGRAHPEGQVCCK